ncbi:TM1266 family iron-only hydrogenase system putative regulator [Scatolibacter rhodanostii]|uniref:TM1266 family iron-only hydrogenase system putative regulator n=1 Tax=Scatolibacter rhodanostii TaxID=2014781 RepID=UPI000C087764|nr:TM1266 family iron-only hydrogenase system putative regulator [Scatolibacter rhodanostii]
MKKIAVIGAILENPHDLQTEFNQLVSDFQGIVKGRMGIPLEEHGVAVISLTVVGEIDEINSLTGKLGALSGATVKAAVSSKIIEN